MKKLFKRKYPSAAPHDKTGIAGLISKVQQQLSAVEKKLDILIGQSPKRPFEQSYSQKPPRRFDHSYRHDRGRQGDGPRERTYTRVVCADCNKECEIPFKPSGDRPVYCKECFSKRKAGGPFNANRDNRPDGREFHREHHFHEGQAEKRQRPGKNKKGYKRRFSPQS